MLRLVTISQLLHKISEPERRPCIYFATIEQSNFTIDIRLRSAKSAEKSTIVDFYGKNLLLCS